jgi:hypothetical protein
MGLVLLILITLAYTEINANDCSQSRYCTPGGWCENFTSLIELNASLFDKTSCSRYFKSALYLGTNGSVNIKIKANNYKGPLNDRFDYIRFIQTTFSQINLSIFLLSFYGFDGIDFNFSLTNNSYSLNGIPFYLHYTFAKFDFYLNGQLYDMSLDGDTICEETELIEIIDKAKYGVFGESSYLSIAFELKSLNSDFKKWCPLIFKNTNLDSLTVKLKPIRFYTGNSNYNLSSISKLIFNNLAADNLDKEILHPQVFSLVSEIWITGSKIRYSKKYKIKNFKRPKTVGQKRFDRVPALIFI